MRLILNFIFFGLFFYAIHLYAPSVFQTLVSWAAVIFDSIEGLFTKVSSQTNSH